MTHISLDARHYRIPTTPIRDWLRHARAALRVSASANRHVPQSFLDDIALTRSDVVRAVDRGTSEIGLLGLGWQKPRRSSF